MVSEKKKKINVVRIIVILGIILAVAGIGAFLYHNHYQQQYKFKGLGDIYKSRNQQYKRFTQRKITFNNKGNPPKYQISQLPSFKKKFTTKLSDGYYMNLFLDFRFKKAEGIKEIRRKWERIDFATQVALTPYTGDELINGNRDEVLVIIENQVRKRIFSEIEYVYVDKFELDD